MDPSAHAGTYRLVGAEVSLYTGKARAYLRYKGIDYKEILATSEIYRQVILPRTGVRYIPIVITDDDLAIQDTTEIIDTLEARFPERAVYPSDPLQRLVALLFEVYGDEWLVLPAMHYRWNYPRNRAFAQEEFGKVAVPQASRAEQIATGEALARRFAGSLPSLGITPQNEKAIEASYLGFLRDFDAHLAQHPFLLGTRPCIGDFGLYGPLYAHLYRDPHSGDVMRQTAPRVVDWVLRMTQPGGEPGAFLPAGRLPDTLHPLLARMFREQVPVLLHTTTRVAQWAQHADSPELPRTVGRHRFEIEGVTATRAIYPYALWMWQRPVHAFQQLSTTEKTAVRKLLRAMPDATALEQPIRHQVMRINNRLRCE